MPTTVVLLHGFAGTGRAWDPVVARLGRERYRQLVPDLRGHGAARAARPVTFDTCVADVLAAAPERFVLCGYSMGGRIALHVALAAPERVERLVLVATTAGIDDEAERAARRADDERLRPSPTRRPSTSSPTAGPPSPCSPARRRTPPASGARTCCATTRAGSPPSCAGWAPAPWSRSGTGCGR